MLLTHDSLRVLDLSYTNMFSGRSAMGIHSIGSALRSGNRGLSELCVRGNNLSEEIVLEFAYSLYFNRGLVECDFSENRIDEKWFLPNHYMLTKLHPQMPSLRTSLDRSYLTHIMKVTRRDSVDNVFILKQK